MCEWLKNLVGVIGLYTCAEMKVIKGCRVPKIITQKGQCYSDRSSLWKKEKEIIRGRALLP